MTHNLKMPLLMGVLMGAMMLMMLHGFLTGETSIFSWATLAFIGAHILVALIALAVVTFGLTRFPKINRFISKLHRPSAKHAIVMLCSAGCTALVVHIVHGGL